jgi:hypothetical protein
MAFAFLAQCCECNKFVDFLKLFEVIDINELLHLVFGFMVDELERF